MLLMEDQNFAPVLLAESLAPFVTEPGQSILMRQNQSADLSSLYRIHQCPKPLATKIHPPAHLFDELHMGESAGGTALFQHEPLVFPIGPLTLADPAIDHGLPRTRCGRPLMSEG